MKEKLKQKKGITLIALVITIIVLLILAGVSIAMLTGENGILTQAQRAKTETENATENEQAILDEYNQVMNNWINRGTTGGNKPEIDGEGYFTKNSTINGGEASANNPTIPAGFKPIDTETSTWGDGTTAPTEENVSNGLVIQDREKNEFVWIPVKSEDEYVRNTSYEPTEVSANSYTDTGYLPDGIQPETDNRTNNEVAERNAVTSKGGFYISRYEAGKEGENTLVSKAGATVWNDILQEDCKTEAKKFINNENVKSALCSGIQWDVIMEFIDGKLDGENNIIDVTVNEHRGGSSESTSGGHKADRMCNIFDLEENYIEFVAECNNYEMSAPYVLRGGGCKSNSSNPVSYRNREVWDIFDSTYYSFRFTLYVM